MAFKWFGKRPDPSIGALYGTIVAQARLPLFYDSCGVPDTLEGRFDMIVLHLVLLIRRLRSEPAEQRTTGQQVFDHFCRDMEHNLRELGLGDTAVPKRMRKFGEAFYGRAAAYDRAFTEGNEALVLALRRNVFGERGELEHARMLARYVQHTEHDLAGQDLAALRAGALRFPSPAEARPAVGAV